jgi:hypothetical protein
MEESGKLHVGVSKTDKSLVATGIRTSGRPTRRLVAVSPTLAWFLRQKVPLKFGTYGL